MAFGMGVLRLSPDAFWGMTLKEMAAVVRGSAPERDGLGREGFAALMRRYPDSR